MRKNSRSVFILILFGVLIAAFVIGLNQHGNGCSGGKPPQDTPATVALSVEDQTVSVSEFTWLSDMWTQFAAGRLVRDKDKKTLQEKRVEARQIEQLIRRELKGQQDVMDLLVERELYAAQAKKLGLSVPDEEIETNLHKGEALALGMFVSIQGHAFKTDASGNNGALDYELLADWLQRDYGWTVRDLLESQRTEWLAQRYKETFAGTVVVAPEELKQWYIDKERKANTTFVQFTFHSFSEGLVPTDAELDAFAAAHKDMLEKQYNERKASFTKQPRTAHLQHLHIALAKDAKEEDVKKAQTVMQSALAQLKKGKPFTAVAAELSEDTSSKNRGGWLGWRAPGKTGFGEALEKKIFAAAAGQLLEPERTDTGLELIRVDGFREGDLSFAQVQRELAEPLYLQEKSKQLAHAAAEAAAKQVRAGAKLTDLFAKPADDNEEAQARTKPTAQETGLVTAQGEKLGQVTSKELVQQVFSKPVGTLIGPLELPTALVLAVVTERKEPDWAAFEKDKISFAEQIRSRKASYLARQWVEQRCNQAKSAHAIEAENGLVQTPAQNAPDLPPNVAPYEACIKRDQSIRSILMQE